jgi:excisionase family DNA binding protein
MELHPNLHMSIMRKTRQEILYGTEILKKLPMTLHVEALIPILGIGRTTAYQLVKSGKISTIKVGQKTRVPREAVLNYMKTKKVKRR